MFLSAKASLESWAYIVYGNLRRIPLEDLLELRVIVLREEELPADGVFFNKGHHTIPLRGKGDILYLVPGKKLPVMRYPSMRLLHKTKRRYVDPLLIFYHHHAAAAEKKVEQSPLGHSFVRKLPHSRKQQIDGDHREGDRFPFSRLSAGGRDQKAL